MWDITGTQTANFILDGNGTGGSVAERLGISWSDTNRRIQFLEQEADARELTAFRRDKMETVRADKQDHVREVTTGVERNMNVANAGSNPAARQNFASLAALSGRIAA
ncbi:MAG: hypothetical protein RMA76_08025 [Deltaproteobacteria bacterium]|jgi:hypothetical protein